MSLEAPEKRSSAFSAFWIFRSDPQPGVEAGSREEAIASIAGEFEQRSGTVSVRAAYSTTGLTAGADLIVWLVAQDVAAIQELGAAVHRNPAARHLRLVHSYLGYAAASQYDPNHGPAFLRGLAPKQYLSVYPFSKMPSWYLLPFEERRALMIEHGRMGNEFPSVLTNTISSFGVADQEFVVALEDDDVVNLIQMVQRLRAAAVRVYTQIDTPVFLGFRKELSEALMDTL